MEYVIHFYFQDSVLLLNGSFVQSATAVRYESSDPLFVTVLPLSAAYIPYTVQIVDGKAVSNSDLAICCDMGGGHRYVELKPRYAYVYSPSSPPRAKQSASIPSQLLEFVQSGNFSAARLLMTKKLGDAISDEALADFFSGVVAVRENIYTPRKGHLLVKSDGTAPYCDVRLSDGLIDEISVE